MAAILIQNKITGFKGAHPKRVYLLSELEFTVGIKRCKVLIYYLIVKNKSYIDEKTFGLVELYHVKNSNQLISYFGSSRV